MDGRPSRRNKAAFSNSIGEVWTRPQPLKIGTLTTLTLTRASSRNVM